MNTAQDAPRNWVLNLGGTLAGKGIYAATVASDRFIGATAPEGIPHAAPDDIARIYWNLHTGRDQAEHLVTA